MSWLFRARQRDVFAAKAAAAGNRPRNDSPAPPPDLYTFLEAQDLFPPTEPGAPRRECLLRRVRPGVVLVILPDAYNLTSTAVLRATAAGASYSLTPITEKDADIDEGAVMLEFFEERKAMVHHGQHSDCYPCSVARAKEWLANLKPGEFEMAAQAADEEESDEPTRCPECWWEIQPGLPCPGCRYPEPLPPEPGEERTT